MEIINKLKHQYINGNIAIKFIFYNVAVFLVFFLGDFLMKNNIINHFFTLSSIFFLSQPWTAISYSFVHIEFTHLLFNMILLYTVGGMFLSHFNAKAFLLFYLLGALAGALVFLLYYNFISTEVNSLMGASAAIFSLFFAVVAYSPTLPIKLMFIDVPVKLQYIALVFLAMDVFGILGGENIGGHLSHLGASAFGYFYMKQYEMGNDFLGSIVTRIMALFIAKPNYTKPPKDDYEYQDYKAKNQKQIDEILDKISRSGYNSLSKNEKELLFKLGK